MNTKSAIKCVVCGRLTEGRADKKYCSERCRNYHNNEKKKRNGYPKVIIKQYPILVHCIVCGKKLKGRTDKKYCSLKCRNYFNNNKKCI